VEAALLEEIAEALARFHREQHGIAPERVVAFRLADMIVVRSDGIFTKTELELCGTEDGRKAVQSARRDLRALTRREVEAAVSRALNEPVLRSYCDFDVRIGEQVEVYMLG
jgi:uncharacterized protein YbcI